MITAKKAIKYKSSDGTIQNAGVLCNVGTFGVDWLKYTTKWNGLFYQYTNPDLVDFELTYGASHTGEMQQLFTYSTTLKSLKIIGDRPLLANINGFVKNCSNLETIDFSESNLKFRNVQYSFAACSKLKTILGELDFSENDVFVAPFTGDGLLEELRLKANSLYISINLGNCKSLSDASIQSIIDGLATVETAQTLTFHADIKAKLTEEQISTITSKNWTLA